MEILTIITVIAISSCLWLMRGGSTWLPQIHRWECVVAQTFVIIPLIIEFNLSWWLALVYPIGWYLTIVWGYRKNYTLRTKWEYVWFFCHWISSYALFAPLALYTNLNWISWFIAGVYTIGFALDTVVSYHFFYKQKGNTDETFNWPEAKAGIVSAIMVLLILIN